MDADTAPFERDVEKAKTEAKKSVKTQLELDVAQAENRLRALRIREEAKKLGLTVNVDADTTKARLQLQLLRAQAEAHKITVRLDADTSPIRSALSKLFGGGSGGGGGRGGGGGFGGGGGLGGFLTGPIGIPLIFTGIGELPAATTAITNVVGAIQQLSGAGAALPGAFAGIASEVGVVKLATMGVSDAFAAMDKASQTAGKSVKEQNKALDEAQAALKDLAPQTADFVRQVYGLKPVFDQLQKGVSGNFFDGLGKSVKDLADNDLPVLNKGLGGIATALNGSLKQIGISLSSDSSKGLLDRIFGNTAEAQTRLTAAIDPLIKGIGTLTAAGTDVLPRLADDVGKVGQRFSAFISEADKNGTLSKFINDGITGVEQLGSTFVNVGKIINDITSAAGGGGGLLKFLDEGSAKLHAFLSSTEGQNQLKKWFEEGRRELDEHIIPLLKSLPGLLEGIYKAGRTIADVVVPPLREVADFLSNHPNALKDALEALVGFKVLSGLGSISNLLGDISGKAGTAGGLLGKLKLGGLGGALALGGALTQPTDGKSGPNGLSALSTVGGGALLGFQVGGPIGAVFGALGGSAVTLTEVFINQANHLKALQQKADDDAKTRPKGSPAVVAPPAGWGLPGTAVAPAPSIVKPSATAAGGLPGLLVPQALQGEKVGPFGTGTPLSVPPTQSNLGSDALSAVADAAKQATSEVGQLSDGINHLPKGEVNIQNNTPQVIDALKSLGYAVQQLPNGHLSIQVEYKDPLGLLTTGGIGHGVGLSTSDGRPILGGHANGGVLPGYSPGVDNMLVPLAGGEGIIKPEVVRKLGPGYIHALNNGFDAGGVVPMGDVLNGGGNDRWGHGGWWPGPAHVGPGAGRGTVGLPNGQGSWPEWWRKAIDNSTFPWWAPAGPGKDPRLHPGSPGYATGGVVQHFGPGGVVEHLGSGALPGPAGPSNLIGPDDNTPAGGTQGFGFGSFFSSLFGGLGAKFGIGGTQGAGDGTGSGLTPGIAGLFQAGNDPTKQAAWGQQTGDWLGKFGANTLLSFGTTLWQGALGLVGLENSILSPSNPWFQDAAKSAGFFLGADGPLGQQGSTKPATAKQLREAQDRVTTTQGSLAVAQARMAELKPDAKDSTRLSATNSLNNAQREADQAQSDFAALQSGSAPSSSTYSASAAGLSGNQAIVYQAMLDAGFPPSEWPALKNIIDRESGFNATARNPSSGAFGMFQFLGHQGDKYGALGGYSTDPAAQARAGLQYIKDSHGGTPSSNWAYWQAHGNYAIGGGVPGSGKGDTVPAMLTPGEHVLTTKDVAALGGQQGVYALREAIHMAAGGAVPDSLVIPLPPLPRPPDAKTLKPRPPRPPAPRVASPAPQAPPSLPDAPTSAAPQNPQFTSPTPTGGANPSVDSHTLPAISKGITSGFATAGAIAQQAVALGAAAATGGASLAAGGGGGGAGGISISGLFQQAGKIANDVADVASAFLVGNVTPGTQESQYGSLLRPAQKVPQTAPLDQGRTYIFNDTHSDRIVDQMRIKDSQDRQAALAQYGG